MSNENLQKQIEQLSRSHDQLVDAFAELRDDHYDLNENYNELVKSVTQLNENHTKLVNTFNELVEAHNKLNEDHKETNKMLGFLTNIVEFDSEKIEDLKKS